MFIFHGPEYAEYTPMVKSKRMMRDLGPDENMIEFTLNLSWALRYIM